MAVPAVPVPVAVVVVVGGDSVGGAGVSVALAADVGVSGAGSALVQAALSADSAKKAGRNEKWAIRLRPKAESGRSLVFRAGCGVRGGRAGPGADDGHIVGKSQLRQRVRPEAGYFETLLADG